VKSIRKKEHRMLKRGYLRVILAMVGVMTVVAMVLVALRS